MSIMIQENLLRLAISLDNQAPSTLNKYICKLVESVLFESEQGKLSGVELSNAIKEKYNLEFSTDEISYAIKHRAKDSITLLSGVYALSPKRIEAIKLGTDMNTLLKEHIRGYKSQVKINFDEEK